MDGRIEYLNTDLDLVADEDLSPLALELRTFGVRALHVTLCDDGQWRAILETDHQYPEPETTIGEMLTAIESLSETSRATWNKCQLRDFNIGYDCGDEPWEYNQGLSNQLLTRLAAIGGSLRISLYPDREPAGPAEQQR